MSLLTELISLLTPIQLLILISTVLLIIILSRSKTGAKTVKVFFVIAAIPTALVIILLSLIPLTLFQDAFGSQMSLKVARSIPAYPNSTIVLENRYGFPDGHTSASVHYDIFDSSFQEISDYYLNVLPNLGWENVEQQDVSDVDAERKRINFENNSWRGYVTIISFAETERKPVNITVFPKKN
ncbi:hypothetical protein A2886_02180 [candidate division WWE3 bacterium RIFCSPHIGHO2_01_FULL_42_13]|uniref:Uncharacterized protein n=1 Tax=candidate division WWE3 bacterium RIFCSPHIGHO2_01_FULL_42_13 TaxID=1802617 RepID=A0A1F4URK1_UNCKA|nr:MAG: hypothetical protein A2886_02180 [candidate division WWE3 bacterium RIFCSPHIGHO2_01_FULL_42_13]